MAKRNEITGRDSYILVQALTFTIEAFSGLPIEFRPDSNITDMKRIIEELVKQDGSLADSQRAARRKLDEVLRYVRRPTNYECGSNHNEAINAGTTFAVKRVSLTKPPQGRFHGLDLLAC